MPSDQFPTLQFSHIPWLLDVDDASEDDKGKLRGHMARANPHAKALIAELKARGLGNDELKDEIAVVFNGLEHYTTPKFYVKTKPESGKVVPTWNYSAVQVYGKARIFWTDSSETGEFLDKAISDLSVHAESNIMQHEKPWAVSDAPSKYVDLLKKAILGIEIEITRMEGKFKMSQEMGAEDRQGVIDGFASLQTDLGQALSETVKQRGILKDQKSA